MDKKDLLFNLNHLRLGRFNLTFFNLNCFLLVLSVVMQAGCVNKPQQVLETNGPCKSVSTNQYAFVGSWEGVYTQANNRQRRWIQNRFCDGTYSLQLYEFEDGYLVDFGQEVGRWWLKNQQFYEQGHSWPLSEVHQYSYEILNSNEIRFKRSDGYHFIDKKINLFERSYLTSPADPAETIDQSI